jgi:glycerol-3-phosphate dehydrogenase (NAD(P)+)
MSKLTNPMKVSIIGAGSWGTAMAIHAARSKSSLAQVTLCPRLESQAKIMREQGTNHHYLADIQLPSHLKITTSWQDIFAIPNDPQHLLIIATPFSGLKNVAQRLLELGKFPKYWIWLCKGIDPDNGKLSHEILADLFAKFPNSDGVVSGILSGPSFAMEVARGLPCALTVASLNQELCSITQTALHHGNMRIYASDDVIGVELGGAIKNILAIATGIADGLQLGLNARAALITRGMAEMTRLGIAMGAHAETFSGLTGLGDLILTATGDLSRNRQVGLALARGEELSQILSQLGHVAEGVRCAQAVLKLANTHHVEMPIVQAVVYVITGQMTAQQAVLEIMARDPRNE